MALSLRQKQIGRSSPARYWNLSLRLSASLPLCLAASLPHCLLYPFHPLLFFFPCSPLRTPPSSPNLTPPSSPNLTPPWHRSSPLHRTAPHPSIAPLLTPPSHHSSPLRPTVRPCGPDAFVRTSISTAPPHASLLLAYAYPFNSHSPFLIPLDPTVRPCAPPDAIVRMLNLNSPVTVTVGGGLASDGDVYKVLLLDKYSRDLISPLLKVSDLRKHGITLHLMVDADRQPIPDVPAVYFLQPTAGNMQRLVLDATRGTYDKMHLNFTSSVPRLLLEDLAAGTLKANALHRVARVFDQYLEFVCLDHGLFSLGQPESYVRLNDPMAKDKDVEGAVESIVNGLFCVLVTLGVVPVIRCPERGPAEMVARQLDAKLRAHLATHNNLFKEAAAGALAAGAAAVASGGGGAGAGAGGGGALGLFQRPLLFIADRNFELAVGVQHEWTYRPLVHDVLGMRLNRVSIHKGGAAGGAGAGSGPLSPVLKGAGGGGGAKATSYELDDSDSFWVAHSESPFPKAAEAVDMLLKKWTQDKEQVNAASPTGDAFSEAEDEDVMGRTKQLSAAMSAVPQLMERKRVIDKHVTIGGTLLEEIKSRALDAYFSMEEDLLTRGSTDRAAMLDLLRKRGSKEDKLRLAIIYLMATDNASAGDVEAVEAALREQQVDLAALHYIKQVKRVNSSFAAVAAAGGGAGGVGGVGGSKDDLLDWAGRLAGQGLSRVTAGVKNLLAGGRQLQLTRAVEALMEGRPGQDTDSFLCLDPKAPKGGISSTAAGGSRGAVRDAIVFVIGGGNYMEYGGLQEMARKAGAGSGAAGVRTVVYGTTEMLAGSQFVEQLSELGRKMGYKAPPLPAESAGGAAGGGGGAGGHR
ncbi:unnamed protein product [Closterium sp. NIES-65]|nr:unnamed protein product [Closterium sp. NIES-65]